MEIEYYKEDDFYCAFISTSGGSGITVKEESITDLAQEVQSYIIELAEDEYLHILEMDDEDFKEA